MKWKPIEEQLEQCEQCFDLFDGAFGLIDKKKPKGTIPTEQLGVAMQSLNYRRKDEELTALINEWDPDKTGLVGHDDFMKIMTRTIEEDPEHQLTMAFRTFDPEATGYMSAEVFRDAMLSMSDSLSEEEVEEMLKEADLCTHPSHADLGEIDYECWIAYMLNPSPPPKEEDDY
eukprot:CAMPEP_0197643814 /NCGR_PEP_ID=MMETSP1338-20131121/17002_1 /TAXON_ID=43686 ORGANISM="Pelagodinium beii, Strain RCC1491" /NCGR_SAMPLE_ID=MMETSP1338 /ASSEMBLY_ACC=CAM_ASM_000754 /LENGTH=172 /DNA_ID=CAMNT_0043217103 /DNA_START=25 /DNA_END=543 /DNA_ORIENTATION=-